MVVVPELWQRYEGLWRVVAYAYINNKLSYLYSFRLELFKKHLK